MQSHIHFLFDITYVPYIYSCGSKSVNSSVLNVIGSTDDGAGAGASGAGGDLGGDLGGGG